MRRSTESAPRRKRLLPRGRAIGDRTAVRRLT